MKTKQNKTKRDVKNISVYFLLWNITKQTIYNDDDIYIIHVEYILYIRYAKLN